ncbi:response regulator [Pseudolabrys sp. FHR47]|uniref:response regulator n=1 Tax=Pseudolabrys sp. FHR47 TaxID=2562284 RepID=UPI00143CD8A9|nr:response regulator [Pseudolabrys sp. FHR47]
MPTSERPLAGKHGLVVDDEFLIALDLEALLANAGAQVVCEGSPDKARAALDDGTFDFAIVDLHIGGGIDSGVSVATLLHERSIPFVFLSGVFSNDPQVTRFNAPLVEKPYRPEALVATIRQLFHKP